MAIVITQSNTTVSQQVTSGANTTGFNVNVTVTSSPINTNNVMGLGQANVNVIIGPMFHWVRL